MSEHIAECECDECKPILSDVQSTSPEGTYYVIIQMRAYREPTSVRPEDEFTIRAYVKQDRFDAIKEAFLDEITMTIDKVAVKVKE
jgi:hypothetical protein